MLTRAPSRRTTLLVDFLVVFMFAAALVWPLFKAKYLDKWASIESTFISDARFLKEHWPHPRWQPLWYVGTRFDYIYPPAIRYGTAALARFYPMTEARAYHLYIAFFYCLGIAGVYLLVRLRCGSRGAAFLAAVSTAVLSPSFLFIADMRNDAWLHHPERLGALVRYGEGPHMTALALLPVAVLLSLRAMEKDRPAALAGAALLCALVVLNNFYGATALAVWFPVAAWSVFVVSCDRTVWLRALAIAALAYGLTAFWLVPSYFRVTLQNLRLVSGQGNAWSVWVLVAVAASYAALTWLWARGRPERGYPVFVGGLFVLFTLNVLGNRYFGFRVSGEPTRLVPELDLAIVLAVVEGLRRLWNYPRAGRLGQAIVLVIVVASLNTSKHYVRRAWKIIVPDPDWEGRVEYKITRWIAGHAPHSRGVATGSLRFWYDAWYDLAQIGGGSEQGLINQLSNQAHMEIVTEEKAGVDLDWMRGYGIDLIIVHDERSREIYHDIAATRKYAGILPVLYDDHEGNVIYQVPRRFPDLARVVETARIRDLPPVTTPGTRDNVHAYAEAVEHGPDSRAAAAWDGTDAMRVHARVEPGQSVLVQVTYDPAWQATSGGLRLAIQRDILGQMLIDVLPGDHDIRLEFALPLENLVGRLVSLVCAATVIALFWQPRRPALR